MNVKPWDVVRYPFEHEGAHYAVIISAPEVCADGTEVNALLCRTLRARSPLEAHEVLVNSADGLDWQTKVDCSYVHELERKKIQEIRGPVSVERRRAIAAKVIEVFRLFPY